ncbi:MAG: hypothetical protein IID44_07465 [Planctomycetes bacterium]|nr:hypothetical protein [Planctomycetota bacterium]
MSDTLTPYSESSILSRVVVPKLTPDSIDSILSMEFPAEDVDRINALAEKSRDGALTDMEREELDNFERVGLMLSILKSKARQAVTGSGEVE